MNEVLSTLGVKKISLNDKYLGSPLFTHTSKVKSCKFILDRVEGNLQNWKGITLSCAGKGVMIHASSSTVPMYQMNCIRIPVVVTECIDKMQRDFSGERMKTVRKGCF